MSIDSFFESIPFVPDPFQREAAESIASGRSVVVTAPTGAGKTLVAEVAVHLAFESHRRAFYTTPIKALSNQKYTDLIAVHGPTRVGLLTGDNVINGDADVVVMTTEVLRNMIYSDASRLDGVGIVVLDEVHYLQDRFRGAVWEEVIIHAPSHIQMVALSATIANAVEFSDWVAARRGPTDLVVATERPVPLSAQYMLKDRYAHEVTLLPTFLRRDGRSRPNPQIERMLAAERGRARRFAGPRRVEVVEYLAERGMLPAIYFIFSRAGCDAAALALVEAGLQMTTPQERARITEIAESRTAHIDETDLAVLGYSRWVTGLEAGVAAHHAGMVPAFKETVEHLFTVGLLRVVFATETLALGINMPARTVVLESLSKFDGESHRLLLPGDYTQLTGRAGRRGIDEVGHGVVLHSHFVPFRNVTQIAAAGSHPLQSSFRPTYNMAANLIAKYDEERAAELLEASFAQFQRRSEAADTEDRLVALEKRFVVEEEEARCELGSVHEFARQAGATAGRDRLSADLRPGDVVDIPSGARAGRYAVLKLLGSHTSARLLVMGTSGRVSTLGGRDVVDGSQKAGRIDLPVPLRPRDRRFRQDTLRLVRQVPQQQQQRRRDERHSDHPVAACPDAKRHLHWLNRAQRTRHRIDELRHSLRARGLGLVGEFESIRSLLDRWGYVEGWALTDTGQRLRFIYNELDLLVAEVCERHLLGGLDALELAALCSTFVYEPRREEPSVPAWPTAVLGERWEHVEATWEELVTAEREHSLPPTRAPDPGVASAVYEWADGVELEKLSDGAMSPGDFVRMSRQLVDLIRQVRDTYPELAPVARSALAAIDRGIVAAQGVG